MKNSLAGLVDLAITIGSSHAKAEEPPMPKQYVTKPIAANKQEAIDKKLVRYYNEHACSVCGNNVYYLSSGRCVDCQKRCAKAWDKKQRILATMYGGLDDE